MYQALRVIWFILIGVLITGYAILDGFDLGAGVLSLFIARTDEERRAIYNAIGVRMDVLPMSPGNVLEALWAKNGT